MITLPKYANPPLPPPQIKSDHTRDVWVIFLYELENDDFDMKRIYIKNIVDTSLKNDVLTMKIIDITGVIETIKYDFKNELSIINEYNVKYNCNKDNISDTMLKLFKL